MKSVLLDTSFLISLFVEKDSLHSMAVEVFKVIKETSGFLIIPQIVLQEMTFNLMKLGLPASLIKDRLLEISSAENFLIVPTDSLVMLRYCSAHYSEMTLTGISKITKTNDYVIASLARDFQANVISSDQQMVTTLKEYNVSTCNFAIDSLN